MNNTQQSHESWIKTRIGLDHVDVCLLRLEEDTLLDEQSENFQWMASCSGRVVCASILVLQDQIIVREYIVLDVNVFDYFYTVDPIL